MTVNERTPGAVRMTRSERLAGSVRPGPKRPKIAARPHVAGPRAGVLMPKFWYPKVSGNKTNRDFQRRRGYGGPEDVPATTGNTTAAITTPTVTTPTAVTTTVTTPTVTTPIVATTTVTTTSVTTVAITTAAVTTTAVTTTSVTTAAVTTTNATATVVTGLRGSRLRQIFGRKSAVRSDTRTAGVPGLAPSAGPGVAPRPKGLNAEGRAGDDSSSYYKDER